jgi:hypothetical protein
MTALFEAIGRKLSHASGHSCLDDAGDSYEAMLGRDRPLGERRAEATRLAAIAPIREMPRRTA